MDDPVSTLMAILNCPEDEAVSLLCQTDFDISAAVALHASGQGQDTAHEATPPSPPPPPMSEPEGPGFVVDQMVDTSYDAPPPRPERGPYAFENASDTRLQMKFTTPSFVDRSESYFSDICGRGVKENKWVLLVLRDNGFASSCVTRDVWNSPAMETTASNFVIHEADVTRDYGKQIASSYKFSTMERNLPSMYIIDPITCHCETQVPLTRSPRSEFDGCAVVNAILEFVADFSSPQDYAHKQEQALLQDSEPPTETIDCDASETANASPSSTPQPSAVPEASASATPPPPLPHAPVSLEAWEVPPGSDGAFRLRCRLPKRTATLDLKPETPVAELAAYLASAVCVEDSETYATPPAIVLRGGFPPKELETPADTTLASWAGVRSGDMLTVQIKS